MKKFIALFAAFACTLPLLMAPTGGFPSRPRFAAVGVNRPAPATGIIDVATDVRINGVSIVATPAGSGTEVQFRNGSAFGGDTDFQYSSSTNYIALGNTASGGGIRGFDSATSGQAGGAMEYGAGNGNGSANGGPLTLTAGSPGTAGNGGLITILGRGGVGASGNGSSIALTAGNGSGSGTHGSITVSGSGVSGTFTATFTDACTTSPTITYRWQKIGNEVTLAGTSSSGFPCTGDSTSFATAAGDVPAWLRPTTSALTSATMHGAQDNATNTYAHITIGTSGILQFSREGTGGVTTTWTASGNRLAPIVDQTVTYLINN